MAMVSEMQIDGLPAGYTARECIFDGPQTRLYRANRNVDNAPVVLKTLHERDAARDAVARLRNEYDILSHLKGARIIQAFGLEQANNLPVLVLEDIYGESLEHLTRRRRFTLEESLGVTAEIALGLAELHADKVIHKDINPANVILNETTGVVRIIDFGIATRLSREYASVAAPEGDPATLAYMSPEQTGRMNRAIDYRTDFYSLGALLYELLTARRMFDVVEPIEWFHCHIAKQPPSPSEIDPAIPEPVSDIVMKLLAKMPENRYQSAVGIHHDLTRCLELWRESGTVEPFTLAERDVPAQFQVPQRLYGRESEVRALHRALDKAHGSISVALVAGRSGVGKSRLINELYMPLTAAHGYFIVGKFDQMHRDVPYSGLAAALTDLVQQLLTESADRLEQWKSRILDALGANVRLVVDLVPELELIVGAHPAVPILPLLEAEQRFQFTLINFVQVFSQPDQPLVLVLDDLQWADSGTLKLADLLMDQAAGDSLLVVGAFRDNEVSEGHPLTDAIEKLKTHDVPVEVVELAPLHIDDLRGLLAEALWTSPDRVDELARLTWEKTGGNPFFIDEFLNDLHRASLITFDGDRGGWTWDLERIRAQEVTDNVVDLMAHRLTRLPDETRQLLELAACAGSRFSLSLLAAMAGVPPRTVAKALHEATMQGLIAPVKDAYQLVELEQGESVAEPSVEFAFAHDRILQSAYEQLDISRRKATHLQVGRSMLSGLSETEQQKHLFAIVKHFNIARELIDDPAELRLLCRLNHEAGRLARQAATYHIAFDHLSKAVSFCDDKAWQETYASTLALYLEAAETAAFIRREEALEQLLTCGLGNARTLLDKVPFHEVQITNYIFHGRLQEAIDLAKPILAKLGHRYPARPNKLHVALKLLALKRKLRKCSLEDLRKLPTMTDPEHLAAHHLGGSIGSAAMFAQPMLLPLMIMHSVLVALEHGQSPQTGSSFITLGMIFAHSMGKVDQGVEYGRLGLDLCERYQDARHLSRGLHVYAALVQHWKEPLPDTYPTLREATRLSMQNGDLEYAIHAATIYSEHAFMAGMELDRLEPEISADLTTFKALQQIDSLHYLQVEHQAVLNLAGYASDPARLVGSAYDIDVSRPQETQRHNSAAMLHVSARAMFLCYSFGEFDEVFTHLERFDAETGRSAGFHGLPWGAFVAALIRLRAAETADPGRRRRLLRKVKREQAWLQRLARTNPPTFQAKLSLVQAEGKRIAGRDFDAHADFDRAIEQAHEAGMIHEQALANELCGAMHMTAGRHTLGMPYLQQARALYQRWGAKAKVDELDRRFQQLKPSPSSPETTTGTMVASNIDIGSLMKGLKAVADEPVHSRMVAAIVEVALEFAGAQRGMLVLRNPRGELCIEAEAEVDGGDPTILQSLPLARSDAVSQVVVNYAARTRNSVVVADAAAGSGEIPGLKRDPYILRNQVRSVLCLPITTGAGEGAELIGLIYLENNRTSNSFTDQRLGMLEIIGVAAAGRLELSRKATVDGLTDLFNHDYFQNTLKQEVATAGRRRRELAVIMLDIDHFKRFNDTWGHQLGDRVLRDVADLLKRGSREGDTVARYGGEEMAVILPDASAQEAKMMAERLRQAIATHTIEVNGQHLGVTVSLGLASIRAGDDAEQLIRRADEALYRSKADGRNRLTVAQ